MRVAVVGGGPAGAMLAFHLARDGAQVTVFDHSHPREKPCGGGFTPRALDLLPEAPAHDPLPVRHVRSCRFDSNPNTEPSRMNESASSTVTVHVAGLGAPLLALTWDH